MKIRTTQSMPWVIFTDLQVAGVGPDEKEAAAQGIPFKMASDPLYILLWQRRRAPYQVLLRLYLTGITARRNQRLQKRTAGLGAKRAFAAANAKAQNKIQKKLFRNKQTRNPLFPLTPSTA